MNKSVTVWKRTALAAICLLLIVCVLFSLIYWLRPGRKHRQRKDNARLRQ